MSTEAELANSSACRLNIIPAELPTLKLSQVWDGLSDARIEFNAEDLLSNGFAQGTATLTENFNLQRALLCHLNNTPTVRILQQTKVTSIQSDGEQHGSWPLVHLDNQQILRARLLVCIFPSDRLSLLIDYFLGWGRWFQFTSSVLCQYIFLWVVIRCSSYCSYNDAPSSKHGTKPHSLSAFSANWAHIFSSIDTNGLFLSLVY